MTVVVPGSLVSILLVGVGRRCLAVKRRDFGSVTGQGWDHRGPRSSPRCRSCRKGRLLPLVRIAKGPRGAKTGVLAARMSRKAMGG